MSDVRIADDSIWAVVALMFIPIFATLTYQISYPTTLRLHSHTVTRNRMPLAHHDHAHG